MLIRYTNPGESQPRFTDRSVRSVVRLFNVDEGSWSQDMAEVERLMFDLPKYSKEKTVPPLRITKNKDGQFKVTDATPAPLSLLVGPSAPPRPSGPSPQLPAQVVPQTGLSWAIHQAPRPVEAYHQVTASDKVLDTVSVPHSGQLSVTTSAVSDVRLLVLMKPPMVPLASCTAGSLL